MIANATVGEQMGGENDYLVERVNDTGHVILIFSHFSHKSDTPPPFAYRHIFGRLDYNRVYIRDRENQWYNRALNGLGDGLAEVTERLRDLLAANGFDIIDCVGNSMGAYGALLFGARLRARNVLAFSPQTFLAPPYPRYDPSYHGGDYVDFRDLDIPGSIRNPQILVSEDELFDLYSLARLPYWRKLGISLASGSSHLVPKTLNDLGVLERLIAEFFHDGTLSLPVECRATLGLESCWKDLVKAIEAYYDRCDASSLQMLNRLLAANPGWAGAHLWAGKACQAAGELEEAISYLETSWRLNAAQYEAAVALANLHAENQEFLKALTWIEQACLLNHVLTRTRNRIAGQALDHAVALLTAGERAEALALADRLRAPFRYELASPLLSRLAAFPFH